MSDYLVRVVGPAGAVSWLDKGCEVELQENAERFTSYVAAAAACTAYLIAARKRWHTPPIAHVFSPEDQ